MTAKQKVVIVGGSLIGACSAFELAAKGADVLVLDASSASATDASFGWINASFFETPEYFALRVEGIAAYHRLQKRLSIPVTWCGGLCWEFEGTAFEAQYNALHAQGYPCKIIERDAIGVLEPDLGKIPDRAIHFTAEGSAEPTMLAERLLSAAVSLGARVARGFHVTGFVQKAGRVVGVQTSEGVFEADQVLVAAGIGTQQLLATLNIKLPMLHRPALVLRTKPIAAKISHILATDFGEVRQLPDGSLMTPASIGHQADASEVLSAHPDVAAEKAMTRLRALFPQIGLDMAAMQLANRPVPKDGFPAVGAVADGLYVATMHSGVTLGALMGDLIAQEILAGPNDQTTPWLSAFRPQRFS
ncbi:FAD-dependent oxidoreductase [Planktotalea sp.]|uniref:NAD(P)/FAD-dependent oxidoreductase n=1 Tax=Planktotalea sp. TaxID=2029877 RepID=UPI0025D4E4C1|nr:FAD-dependent oxidoreductase [Planktotalea sp.]